MYIKPTEGYTIYTKSLCPSCTEVKKLLPKAKYVNCDEYLEEADEFLDFIWSLTDKTPSTITMVFKDGVYVGGYKEVANTFSMEAEF